MSILIVGDGDFSFSRSVSQLLNQYKIKYFVTSCYENNDEIINKYSKANENINCIEKAGGTIVTNLNATNIKPELFAQNFECVIFNFPHVGGKSNIKKNRNLMKDFFRSIKLSGVLDVGGTVCVSLCRGQAGTKIDLDVRQFNDSWQLEEMAAKSGFVLLDVLPFCGSRFVSYTSTGYRSQEKRFQQQGSRTYVFVSQLHPERVVKEAPLTTTFSWDGEEFLVSSWIQQCLSAKDTILHRTASLLISDHNGTATCMAWPLISPETDYAGGYRCIRIDKVDSFPILQLERFLLFKQGSTGFTEGVYLVCNSVWRALRRLICQFRGGVAVSQGFVFHPCSSDGNDGMGGEKETEICVEYFLVSMEVAQSREDDAISMEEMMKRGRVFGEFVVHVGPMCVQCSVVSVSESVGKGVDVCMWEYANLDMVSGLYCRVFGGDEEAKKHQWLTRSQMLHSIHNRDLSFWHSDSDSVCSLMASVSEVVRSVLWGHIGGGNSQGRVTVVEHFVSAEGRRSLCVRMKLVSSLDAVLDRSRINVLQSRVRLTCQALLDIELR